jgi:proteasome accessory factor C
MDTQKKVLEVFRLIMLLNTPPSKDVSQLVRRLGSSSSTVYRDLKILESIGYPIETDDKKRKSLKFTIPKSGNGVLSLDDISYLQDLLEKEKSPQSINILEKFNRNLNLIPIADALPQLHQNHILQLARIGINTGSCLRLHRYRSLTGNSTKNRLVEPLEITEDERYLIAWDIDKDDQRQFKINRIEDIDILDRPISSGKLASPMDLFGLTGKEWTPVKMKLSRTAHHLLLEEFPLSRAFIRTVNNEIIFDGMVRNWKGIGRFVLGLPGEVAVLGPDEFKGYLEGRRELF